MTSKICIAGGISAAYSFQMSKDPTVDEIKKIHNEQYLKVDDIKEALKKMSEKAPLIAYPVQEFFKEELGL